LRVGGRTAILLARVTREQLAHKNRCVRPRL